MSPFSLAIWERARLADINRELAPLTATGLPRSSTRLHTGRIEQALVDLIDAHGYDAKSLFPAWLADMTRLSRLFFELANGQPVTARLETLAGTGCPRFHVDHSYLRLVCSYRGPGTEWLEDAQVDREAQATGAPNEAIIRFGQPGRIPTFAVGLMKGNRFPGYGDAGLVHRSPVPDPADPVRVLFCLDC